MAKKYITSCSISLVIQEMLMLDLRSLCNMNYIFVHQKQTDVYKQVMFKDTIYNKYQKYK